jgi:hypothetical protein
VAKAPRRLSDVDPEVVRSLRADGLVVIEDDVVALPT